MQVMAWSENLNLEKCKELDVLPSSKDSLIENSDFISIHVQGGERYQNCITLKEFDKMKKSAYLINTSRGPIVNEDDLIIALSTNVISGAGIDVYEKEPLPENNKLRFLPNALLLPHIGYVTAENYSIFYTQMFENLEACVNDKPIRVIVTPRTECQTSILLFAVENDPLFFSMEQPIIGSRNRYLQQNGWSTPKYLGQPKIGPHPKSWCLS